MKPFRNVMYFHFAVESSISILFFIVINIELQIKMHRQQVPFDVIMIIRLRMKHNNSSSSQCATQIPICQQCQRMNRLSLAAEKPSLPRTKS